MFQSPRKFPPPRDFASLSIADLIEARDTYHVYLSSLANVTATAIGRYLIHRDDWYATHSPDTTRPDRYPKPIDRTLQNSVVRPWSWPAVLVFVKEWQDPKKLGADLVPRALYLEDGRVIPTCVVLAAPDESQPPAVPGPSQASETFGGGYACVRTDQGIPHVGTIGCLVQRGGVYYALTNGHVAGSPGEAVFGFTRGEARRIGVSDVVIARELPFRDVFPTWSGARTRLTLDAGLIRIDDINDWTAQAFGIGEIGEAFDATANSINLDLIGCPLRAFGGVSGVIEGEIRALFFRYQSLGGDEHVTDLLIGPVVEKRDAPQGSARMPSPPFTRPGDSGTLWFYDPPSNPADGVAPERGLRARRLIPIAMQWGGERFAAGAESSAFALASYLSTICRQLEVDVVRDWSTGHDEYWGKIGHFTVGWKACDQLTGRLQTIMTRNQERIGFDDQTIGRGSAFKMGQGAFVPLADVPDYVWVNARSNEPLQHFADVDIADIDGHAPMLDRCVQDASQVAASVWKEYFDGFKAAGVGPDDGALPFRVWQIWEAMVGYLKQQDLLRFVAAAGVLAHYVGDASQPLHCSYLHHGVPPMLERNGRKYPVRHGTPAYDDYHKTPRSKIHGIYEETMLEIDTVTVLREIDQRLKQSNTSGSSIASGHDAAVAIVHLMDSSRKRLAPMDIIQADDPTLTSKACATRLWNNPHVRAGTLDSLADSVRLLADLWKAAWSQGAGNALPASLKSTFDESELEDLYRNDPAFLPSMSLDEMMNSGSFEPEGAVRGPQGSAHLVVRKKPGAIRAGRVEAGNGERTGRAATVRARSGRRSSAKPKRATRRRV